MLAENHYLLPFILHKRWFYSRVALAGLSTVVSLLTLILALESGQAEPVAEEAYECQLVLRQTH